MMVDGCTKFQVRLEALTRSEAVPGHGTTMASSRGGGDAGVDLSGLAQHGDGDGEKKTAVEMMDYI